jgi:serpin B
LVMASETLDEKKGQSIRATLFLPRRADSTRTLYKKLSDTLNKLKKGKSVVLANSIWNNHRFDLSPELKSIMSKYYSSTIEPINVSKPTESAGKINDWVSDKTNKMINDIVSPNNIDENSKMILVSSIYFKDSWSEKFYEKATKKKTFTTFDKREIEIDFMHKGESFPFAQNDSYKMLRLNYLDRNSMYIILPKANDISELENGKINVTYKELKKKLKGSQVKLSLPKFKIDWEAELADKLQAMGMQRVFAPNSNLDLYIDKVKHKAAIEVNENGTEAAAATVVIACDMAVPPGAEPEYKVFNANHPFIFIITDDVTDNILFIGKLEDPSK